MAGLTLKVGGFGGVGSTGNQNYGTQPSYDTVTSAAFGPGATVQTPSAADTLAPNDGFGLAFTAGVVAVVLLVVIRQSLPGGRA
jgi:hypothetical protein